MKIKPFGLSLRRTNRAVIIPLFVACNIGSTNDNFACRHCDGVAGSNPEYHLILYFIFPDCFGLRLAMTATPDEPGCHFPLFVATNIIPRNDATPNERNAVVTFLHSASK
ncbi:MAG: hypothetical protein LBR10_02605 [Prevotellaceae bacterium]|jgi:hypothetical protein|nr:hypothetical protein [Prevotellaceae bacterium]